MLNAINLSRDNVSIVPILFWRTPGGRTATDTEIELARPFVWRAIELLAPRAILTMGTLAAREIVGVKLPDATGKLSHTASDIAVMPIYHPSFLMLKPDSKRAAWVALQELQNLLKNAEI
jgi:DNA polymerase